MPKNKCWHSDCVSKEWPSVRNVQSKVSLTVYLPKILPVCFFVVCVGCSAATHPGAESVSLTLPSPPNSATDQAEPVGGIIGTWEATQFGHQVLTTRPDGTATIKMSLTPLAAVLYGRQVTLDLRWTLDGQLLTQHIIGGSPSRSVEKLIAKFGDTQKFRVLETKRDQLLVAKALADSHPVCWTAVAPPNQ